MKFKKDTNSANTQEEPVATTNGVAPNFYGPQQDYSNYDLQNLTLQQLSKFISLE